MVKSKRNFLLVIIMIFLTSSTSCKTNEIKGIIKKSENQKKPLLASNLKFSNIPDLKVPKDNINIIFEGRSLKLISSIYNDKNRLYLPFSEIIDKLDGKIVYN